ncbi:ATP-grasp domain-containing protein [Saccharibacillus brassicae]|uniref:ATP-grasp domain-containing protein n=1 Tax=Saccharibacillus brassicae TaxID=2583377 RepID=A0A4Y6UU29_SACBS|nr:ATP-grasp domain-containing protein [Saccharibacillus brassicae]QDH19837.1 ATP-grasp domain-containing protein [Saccharibacillus brassicae]
MAHLLMIESWVGASGRLLPVLLEERGHTYTFVTRRPGHYGEDGSESPHPVLAHAQEVLIAETNDTAELIEKLRPYAFDGVITVCDYYIDTVKDVAQALSLPCPFPAAVGQVRNKYRMREALDRAGLANPSYRIVRGWEEARAAAEEIGYPLVAKPVDLASSAFVNLIRDAQELHMAYAALENFPLNFRDQERDRRMLLEAFMEGSEVSVESVCCEGEIHTLGITDKSVTGTPYFIENGHMFPAQLSEETAGEVRLFVESALEAVGFDHGIAHTEVMLTADGPRIVEINPRTAGNYIVELVHHVTGLDLLDVFVDLALGCKPVLNTQDRGVRSAAIAFLVPPKRGLIEHLEGTEELANDARLARFQFADCESRFVEAPIDNACYLGHVVAIDREGRQARSYAEDALSRIRLRYAAESEVSP